MTVDFLLDDLAGEEKVRAMHILKSALSMYYAHLCDQQKPGCTERRLAYLVANLDSCEYLMESLRERMVKEGVE